MLANVGDRCINIGTINNMHVYTCIYMSIYILRYLYDTVYLHIYIYIHMYIYVHTLYVPAFQPSFVANIRREDVTRG